MGNKRESYTANENSILYGETGGICPLCNCPIMHKKEGSKKPIKGYEIAHIYPLNPTTEQQDILKGYPVPIDINALENLIALCPTCHTKYDKDFKLEELKNLESIKKGFLEAKLAAESISKYQLEKEVLGILDVIIDFDIDDENVPEINMDLSTIDQKLKKGMEKIQVREIKRNAADYYFRIREHIKLLEQQSQITVRKLQFQIATYYLHLYQQFPDNKDLIFHCIAKWIERKSGKSIVASKILVAFFIQNCEVFDADPN
ncbi:TPA: HNH endonuclease [Acinetobacter nosocomialis]|nr:HNH endonuclease [Acinetobacter nosocomialis]